MKWRLQTGRRNLKGRNTEYFFEKFIWNENGEYLSTRWVALLAFIVVCCTGSPNWNPCILRSCQWNAFKAYSYTDLCSDKVRMTLTCKAHVEECGGFFNFVVLGYFDAIWYFKREVLRISELWEVILGRLTLSVVEHIFTVKIMCVSWEIMRNLVNWE